MTRRSVMNDRYRVERSGKTRKSASAAKPKRAAGEAAAAPAKKSAKPKSALGRAVGRGQTRAASTMSAIERSPREKQLRRIWWVLLGVALALAGVMYFMSVNKLGTSLSYRAVLVGYVTAIAGALYLEFGPLRRARMEAVAASKSGKKTKASADTTKPGAGTTTQTPSAPAESKPAVPVTAAGRTRATEALTRLFRRGGDSGGGSDPGEGGAS